MTDEPSKVDPYSDVQVPALALMLLQQSNNYTAEITNNLVDGLQRSIDERNGELMLIRSRIKHMLSGPYMPSAAYILNALYPTWEDIQEAAENTRRDREAQQQ